ncbi:autoinducer-2 (AI-2) kinase [Chlamydia trachomatis]|nr:autoinducer-2 (AI-2) kinase [Chlamydia trachomatis]
MLAAYGCGWYNSLEECADLFISTSKTYQPKLENVPVYKQLYALYKEVYYQTKDLSKRLNQFSRK